MTLKLYHVDKAENLHLVNAIYNCADLLLLKEKLLSLGKIFNILTIG
jgi:hypothetical protein